MTGSRERRSPARGASSAAVAVLRSALPQGMAPALAGSVQPMASQRRASRYAFLGLAAAPKWACSVEPSARVWGWSMSHPRVRGSGGGSRMGRAAGGRGGVPRGGVRSRVRDALDGDRGHGSASVGQRGGVDEACACPSKVAEAAGPAAATSSREGGEMAQLGRGPGAGRLTGPRVWVGFQSSACACGLPPTRRGRAGARVRRARPVSRRAARE